MNPEGEPPSAQDPSKPSVPDAFEPQFLAPEQTGGVVPNAFESGHVARVRIDRGTDCDGPTTKRPTVGMLYLSFPPSGSATNKCSKLVK